MVVRGFRLLKMSAEDLRVYLRLFAVAGIVAGLWLLSLGLAREWVKSDLSKRGFRPVRVRWRPFTWWPVWGPAFQVHYQDADGFLHQARCGLPAWHRPVVWRSDEVINLP